MQHVQSQNATAGSVVKKNTLYTYIRVTNVNTQCITALHLLLAPTSPTFTASTTSTASHASTAFAAFKTCKDYFYCFNCFYCFIYYFYCFSCFYCFYCFYYFYCIQVNIQWEFSGYAMIIQIWTLNISQPFIYLTLMQATINYIFIVFQMWRISSQSIGPWPCIKQSTPYSNRISAQIWIFTLNIRYRTNWISLPEYSTLNIRYQVRTLIMSYDTRI